MIGCHQNMTVTGSLIKWPWSTGTCSKTEFVSFSLCWFGRGRTVRQQQETELLFSELRKDQSQKISSETDEAAERAKNGCTNSFPVFILVTFNIN